MTSCPTQFATIELGLAQGRQAVVASAIRQAAKDLGLCIKVVEAWYACPGGDERGLEVSLLVVPGMSATARETALGLARGLLGPAGQRSTSVVFPDETLLVTEGDNWPS